MKIRKDQIEEIADNLDSGMRCFYNTKTGNIITIIDVNSWDYSDDEAWSEEIEQIEQNREDYFEFTAFESYESFQIMVDFTEEIENDELRNKLTNILNCSKPFRNFKWQIDNSGEYRQRWFDFKKNKYILSIKSQVNENIEDFE